MTDSLIPWEFHCYCGRHYSIEQIMRNMSNLLFLKDYCTVFIADKPSLVLAIEAMDSYLKQLETPKPVRGRPKKAESAQ